MIQLAALAPLLNVGEKLIDKLWPDPESAARAKIELANQIATIDLTKDKQFQDFIVAYEGRGESVHPWIQLLRGSVRPIITYALAGTFLWGFVNPGAYNHDTMQLLWQLNLISLSFWYGERALKNLGLNLSKTDKIPEK
jgi:hypothetical protein